VKTFTDGQLQLVWLFFGEDIHRRPTAVSVAVFLVKTFTNGQLQLVWLFFGEDIHKRPTAVSVAVFW